LVSRRQFVAGLASVLVAGTRLDLPRALAGEARVISWPSRVVQLPPDDENQKPPVVTAVRLHRDGQLLATAGDDHCVRVWSLADGKLVHKLSGHSDWVRTVDYSPDGRVLASAGNDRQIIFWDAKSGEQLDVLATHQAAIAAIRFSYDGKLIVAAGFEETVRIYDTATKQLAASLPAPCQDMRAVTFSHDDQTLAVGGRCGTVRLFSVARGQVLRDIPAHRQRIRAIAFSSDDSYVASSGEDRLIHVAPLARGDGYSLPPRPAKVLSLAFYGPQQLATAGSDNQIRLWDVAIKEEIGCLRGHTGSVAALECKDKVLVSAGYDTTVRVWDVGDQVAAGGGAGPGRVGARPAEPRTR
jgi:dipeptidyl aminopeptidase/acylaminoacyl peptidase